MKKIRWQLITIFLTGLVVGILLLADSSTGPIQVFESHPTTGGIYREGLVGQIQRLNPLLTWYNDVDDDVCRLIFSGLIKNDTRGIRSETLPLTGAFLPMGRFIISRSIRMHSGMTASRSLPMMFSLPMTC